MIRVVDDRNAGLIDRWLPIVVPISPLRENVTRRRDLKEVSPARRPRIIVAKKHRGSRCVNLDNVFWNEDICAGWEAVQTEDYILEIHDHPCTPTRRVHPVEQAV